MPSADWVCWITTELLIFKLSTILAAFRASHSCWLEKKFKSKLARTLLKDPEQQLNWPWSEIFVIWCILWRLFEMNNVLTKHRCYIFIINCGCCELNHCVVGRLCDLWLLNFHTFIVGAYALNLRWFVNLQTWNNLN